MRFVVVYLTYVAPRACLTFGLTFPGVVVQFVSAQAAAVPRQAVLALRTLVVTAAVVHRAVSGCLSCHAESHLHISTFTRSTC